MKTIKKSSLIMALVATAALVVLSLEVKKMKRTQEIPEASEVSSLVKPKSKEIKEEARPQAQKLYEFLKDLVMRSLSKEVNKKEAAQAFIQVRTLPLELQLCNTLKDLPSVSNSSWSASNTARFCRALYSEEGVNALEIEKAWERISIELRSKGYEVKKDRELVTVSWE